MAWDGAVNAWHVAGDVYRMGRREWLTEAGWRQAHDAGIRTVVDLRNEPEIRRRETDPPVRPAALAGFDVVLASTENPANTEFRKLCVPYLNHPAAYADNARLFPELLAGVFKALAAAQGGVVIHCSAGRDRSGMIAAMIQDLAGHSDEAIVQGYQRAMQGINEHHRRAAVPHPHERYLPDDVLSPLLEERGASLLQFVRSLNTAEFLRRHGLTGRELEAILAKVGR
ncbi:tyrosine-protein phosphatase [Arthrobacter sp. ov118]|uniref:tyrosine-protein phosphatase n=1 Tax=Arthrobacter sp. ov118 TaxID=1761747 RepID=UPI0008E9E733|nr:tyrosine-protein phosphatase [Arthrobacter sp. ov118]SFT48187.1 Tyrosine phosphatase family protein [Arthrobacter sp. ov118]